AGILFLWRYWPNVGLLYWYLAAALLIQFFTFILSRFRLAFVPVLILAGAALLVQVFDALRKKRFRQLIGILVVVSTIVLIQQLWAPFGDRGESGAALDHLSAASVYSTEHRFDQAIQEIAQFRRIAGATNDAKSPDVAITAARITGNTHIQWAF